MKKIFLMLSCVFALGIAKADDLEAIVVDSEEGGSTGEIDLIINGGTAPFVFNWIGPDGFTSTEEDLSGLEPGTYTITVSDKYCGVAVLEVEVGEEDENSSTISEDENPVIKLYPNPTTGLFYVSANTPVDVVVYNIIGERIFAGTNVKEVNLTDQSSGIYMVQISTADITVTRKITIQ